MAVPKRRTSKARRDKRRASVSKIKPLNLSRCKNCGELLLSHRVCGSCGYYKGVQLIKAKEA